MKLSKNGLFYKWLKFSINLTNNESYWNEYEPADNICILFWQVVAAVFINFVSLLFFTVLSVVFFVAPWTYSMWLALSMYLLYVGILMLHVREQMLSTDSKLYNILSYEFLEREVDYDKEPNAIVKAIKDFVGVGVVFAKSHKNKVCVKVEWKD